MAYQISSDPRPFAGMRNVISKVCPSREGMLGATTGSRQRGKAAVMAFQLWIKRPKLACLPQEGELQKS